MFPFTGLRLMAPAIIPSWRFFDTVGASPRLDYALLASADEEPGRWHAFRPRVPRLSIAAMLGRLVWNPEWNEALFLVSLAERLMTSASPATQAHSERELLLRVARHLDRAAIGDRAGYLRIRLCFVGRMGPQGQVDSAIVYVSGPHARADLAAR